MELRMSNIQRYTPPTLAELTADAEEAFKSDSFKQFLNMPTPAKFVRHHPIIKVKDDAGNSVPMPYVPIGFVEHMMDSIFKANWHVEIKDTGTAFNGVWVTVRVHFLNPVTGSWQYQDGIGAEGLQTDSGAHASDMSKIKQSAITMAFPKAKTAAIKDACDHLGKLFGRDLTRLAQADHKPDTAIQSKVASRTLELISDAKDLETLNGYRSNAEAFDLMDAWNIRADQLKAYVPTRTRKVKVNPHR
jgi:hypothetical protein